MTNEANQTMVRETEEMAKDGKLVNVLRLPIYLTFSLNIYSEDFDDRRRDRRDDRSRRDYDREPKDRRDGRSSDTDRRGDRNQRERNRYNSKCDASRPRIAYLFSIENIHFQ